MQTEDEKEDNRMAVPYSRRDFHFWLGTCAMRAAFLYAALLYNRDDGELLQIAAASQCATLAVRSSTVSLLANEETRKLQHSAYQR